MTNYRNASGRDAQGRYPYRQPTNVTEYFARAAAAQVMARHSTRITHAVAAAQGEHLPSMVYSPVKTRVIPDHRRGAVSPLGGRAW
jgi:hypothetical protein